MNYQQLTEGQRYQISVLREDNLSCREIGIRIGVSKSTVSRELRRNSGVCCLRGFLVVGFVISHLFIKRWLT